MLRCTIGHAQYLREQCSKATCPTRALFDENHAHELNSTSIMWIRVLRVPSQYRAGYAQVWNNPALGLMFNRARVFFWCRHCDCADPFGWWRWRLERCSTTQFAAIMPPRTRGRQSTSSDGHCVSVRPPARGSGAWQWNDEAGMLLPVQNAS